MKYRAKNNLLEELKSLPYFNKNYVFQLGKDEKNYNLKNSTINTYISRFLKNKEIISLKRGVYVTTDFYNKHKGDTSYLFYLANILRKPSYVSSWTALQHYNLATEIIHTTTSVTTKVTRDYKTKIGTFSYQSVKENLFSDFSLVKGDFEFFIATPAKALFDLLYFKTRQFRGVKFKNINLLIEELRININEMKKEEQNKFYSMVKNYMHYE
jgi:predicted transcriptional regulator of viral defense system